MIKDKWAVYFMIDGGKSKQWTTPRFDTAIEAIRLSIHLNAENGLRFP